MEPNLNKYKLWLKFLKEVVKFFENEGFTEVKTPTLVPSGAMEASLETLRVENSCYLPTSPEFSLKKLWLSDLELGSIFEISPSFRREELGKLHLTEFNMLEFYKSQGELKDLKRLITKFFQYIFQKDMCFTEVCLSELFYASTGFKLKPDSNKSFLIEVCDFHRISFGENFSWNDLYQIILIELIEPLIPKANPVFLTNYPPQVAALAKINNEGWADRIEVFYRGVELGNGYNELFDSTELLRRWKDENLIRGEELKTAHPIDHELIKLHEETHLKQGVGMAIGLERVFQFIQNPLSPSMIKVWPFRSEP